MSLLKDIAHFKAKTLRKTDTTVTTCDGRKLLEKKDGQGQYSHERIGQDLGFVGDYKPDLQVGVVLPGLLLGSQDVAANQEALCQHHVTHILNLAPGIEPAFPDPFVNKTIAILDIPETDITEYFPECFDFINEARTRGCVLVHCNAGVSRSASVVIGYLMKHENMTFEDTYCLVKEKRPSIQPNAGFLIQLRNYKQKESG